jgi:hypothetical protein
MFEQEEKEFKEHLLTCSECQKAVLIFNSAQRAKEMHSAPLNVIQDIFENTTRKKYSFFAEHERSIRIAFAFAASLLIGVFITSPSRTPTIYFTSHDLTSSYYEEIEKIDSAIKEIETVLEKI